MAGMCEGLPLAVVVIADFLKQVEKTKRAWEEIANTNNMVKDSEFKEVFSLVYHHLPHHLKSCLLYFGAFSNNKEISVYKTVKLWVAEGFLKQIPNKTHEEVAVEYIKELVSWNLIFVGRRVDGSIKTIIVHDLLNEVCLIFAKEEHFLVSINASSMPTTQHVDVPSFDEASEAEGFPCEGVLDLSRASAYRFFLDVKSAPHLSFVEDEAIKASSFLKCYMARTDNESHVLENLHTLLYLRGSSCAPDFFAKTPNLKKLGISLCCHFLRDEDSWRLLCLRVFDDEHCPFSELEEIGRLMPGMGGGFPLAVVVIAGFLKQISVSKVVKLWVAEGFLKQIRREKDDIQLSRFLHKSLEGKMYLFVLDDA
ncbi:hypothetical protein M569_07723 [Genlisea aurea]|uniref:Disease resistance protein winged helix domain-containing protein n=1 Tax=Genlisea aurea TaxID=192259 RepID=S8DV61_9LAMI|nr:hypothetical protein M569_07723 [Genlisea aurea]